MEPADSIWSTPLGALRILAPRMLASPLEYVHPNTFSTCSSFLPVTPAHPARLRASSLGSPFSIAVLGFPVFLSPPGPSPSARCPRILLGLASNTALIAPVAKARFALTLLAAPPFPARLRASSLGHIELATSVLLDVSEAAPQVRPRGLQAAAFLPYAHLSIFYACLPLSFTPTHPARLRASSLGASVSTYSVTDSGSPFPTTPGQSRPATRSTPLVTGQLLPV